MIILQDLETNQWMGSQSLLELIIKRNGYNYVTLSGLYAIDDNYWIINPQSEGEQNINKPIVVKN